VSPDPRFTALWTRAPTAILVALVLAFGASRVFASPQSIASDSNDGDWVYVDHDLAGTRYSHLKQITTKNVSQLVKACAYSFPDKEPSQTAPIVSAGTMYLTNCPLYRCGRWRRLPRDLVEHVDATRARTAEHASRRGSCRREGHSRYQ